MLILFDVDGTLTPSRGQIDAEFKHWLMNSGLEFQLVTGSDPDKTQEQIGVDLWSSVQCHNCCGNHVFDRGTEVYRSRWQAPPSLIDWLESYLVDTPWRVQTGRHLEHRTGLMNFSVVGRNASPHQRREYFDWDRAYGERERLARKINAIWPTVECTVAGETGIDIYERGRGKAQVLQSLPQNPGHVHFFGDRTEPGGNDHGLAQAIVEQGLGTVHQVQDWQHTWRLLQSLTA